MRSALHGLAVVLLLLAGCTASRPRPTRVLFVGNSYTYFNNLPALVGALGDANGVSMEPVLTAAGAYTLQMHVEDGVAASAKGFDAVVLQEQSRRPVLEPELLVEAASAFTGSAPKLVLFATWARRGVPEDQTAIDAAYRRAGAAARGIVAHTAEAWQRALKQRPGLRLYHDDGSHPTPAGSYLAAIAIYRALTGQPPRVVPARIVGKGFDEAGNELPVETVLVDLPPQELALFEQVAASLR
jgi:hypothetical protein